MTITASAPKRWRQMTASVAVLALTVMATGCASGSGGASGEDEAEGVPRGASMEEYQAALEDMEPIDLVMQLTTASPESAGAQSHIDFAERVEEWSGGKMRVEIVWASAIAPPTETDDALIDGRIDLAWFHALYEPDSYPANAILVEATMQRDPSVLLGNLAYNAAFWEVGTNTPEVMAEFEDQGLTVLTAITPLTGPDLFCTSPRTSLDDFAGVQIRVSGPVHTTEVEALGAVPVSLGILEVYEGLQRGIVDCAVGAIGAAQSMGWLEVAPYVIQSDIAAWGSTPGSWLGGTRVTDLPIAARQLLIDLMPGYFAAQLESGVTESYDLADADIEQYGGRYLVMEDDASEALQAANEGLAEAWLSSSALDGADLVQRLDEANGTWAERLEALGYPNERGDSLDMQPWIDAVTEEIIPLYRP